MKGISLFTGIAGFDLGFQRAGITTVAMVERDAACRALLARRFPGTLLFDDVCTFGKKNYDQPIDVLSGGFPCQDLSVAGERAGLAGKRSGLFFEFARCANEFKPAWIVIENVPGLLSSNDGRDFSRLLYTLVQSGYCLAWRVFDSQFFNVPQQRQRVFIVGSFGNGRAAEILFERESLPGHFAPRPEAGQTTAAILAGGAGTPSKAYGEHTFIVSGSVSAKWHKGSSGPSGDEVRNVVAFTPRRTNTNFTAQSPTLNTGGGGFGSPGIFHPTTAPRRLTPLECERLQAFPDGWTEGQSDTARYKQLGNAVTVTVAEWIGRRIVSCQ